MFHRIGKVDPLKKGLSKALADIGDSAGKKAKKANPDEGEELSMEQANKDVKDALAGFTDTIGDYDPTSERLEGLNDGLDKGQEKFPALIESTRTAAKFMLS